MKPPLQSLLKMVLFDIIFLAGTVNTFAQSWNQIIKITASNNGSSSARSVDDNFAYSVAISGNYAIVGAFQEDSDANGLNNVNHGPGPCSRGCFWHFCGN
jgi:hypothetical protein